jgi:hypothetical protein
MIATQQIKSTTSKPVILEGYETINVLKWNNSKWKVLCPYFLKTDGKETCSNPGEILFENFYQGCKVYDVVYKNEVYPSKYQINNPKYLWWKFEPLNPSGDVILEDDAIDYELYYRWRNSIWECKNPIRYPNKIHRRKNFQFALCIDEEGTERRLDYVSLRKEIYVKEYIRLIKKLPEYETLLNKLKKGRNIMICEVDVPSKIKNGEHGKDCDVDNICYMTIEKLELLLNDTSESFGHGLCLAYSLLIDLQTYISSELLNRAKKILKAKNDILMTFKTIFQKEINSLPENLEIGEVLNYLSGSYIRKKGIKYELPSAAISEELHEVFVDLFEPVFI